MAASDLSVWICERWLHLHYLHDKFSSRVSPFIWYEKEILDRSSLKFWPEIFFCLKCGCFFFSTLFSLCIQPCWQWLLMTMALFLYLLPTTVAACAWVRTALARQYHSFSVCSISVAPSRKNSTNKPFCSLSAPFLPQLIDLKCTTPHFPYLTETHTGSSNH